MNALSLLPTYACNDAREWVESAKSTPEQLWQTCERADWLLWLAATVGVERRLVVLAACDCAETAPGHKDNPKVGECLRATRLWCAGRATAAQVRRAAAEVTNAVHYATYAASAATNAANTAADAANAANTAADAANDAADAATYAANAATSAANSLGAMAVLVRKRIPWSAVEAKLSRGGK